MEAQLSKRKRSFSDDDGDDEFSNRPHRQQKRIRFPKGKKVKPGDEAAVLDRGKGVTETEPATELKNPRLAAKERINRRNEFTAKLLSEEGTNGILNNVSAAEVAYDNNENFVEDGIQIEPFNLDQEREEGYFDAEGNFVEYVDDNETKDPWLDSIEVDTKYSKKEYVTIKDDNDTQDLSADDIGKMKRQIADALRPGETILQALRRLKGISNKRKEKMSAETKLVFDQLTEDAMKLMENGDYNVYHEMQEVFEREAEGYESLVRARSGVTSTCATDSGVASSASVEPSSDAFDMFAEDDEHSTAKPSSDEGNRASGLDSDGVAQPSSHASNTHSESGAPQSDYIYDESSGYSLSSSLHPSWLLCSTITIVVLAITMIRLLDYIALLHQETGTPSTKKLAHMMKLVRPLLPVSTETRALSLSLHLYISLY